MQVNIDNHIIEPPGVDPQLWRAATVVTSLNPELILEYWKRDLQANKQCIDMFFIMGDKKLESEIMQLILKFKNLKESKARELPSALYLYFWESSANATIR